MICYVFQDFRYERAGRVLTRGSVEVPLTPKTRDLLELFLASPRRLITRQEILERLWPDVVVSDEALRFQVGELRKALGDASGELIRTIPREGYRWEGPVRQEPEAAPGPPAAPVEKRRVVRTGLALLIVAFGGFALGRRSTPRPLPRFQQLTFRRGAIWSARFADDGRTVVYGAAWEGRPVELYVTRPGSPDASKLELPEADILAISRRGEMAISLNRRFGTGLSSRGTLALCAISGGVPREVAADVQEAAWHPKGDALAIVREVEGRCRLEFPIGTVLYSTGGWISHPRFSPRGDEIAFLDHPEYGDDRGAVAVVELSGRKRTLSDGWSSAQGLAFDPSGKEVWFTASDSGLALALYAVTRSGRVRTLARIPSTMTLQDVAPDGRVLFTQDSIRAGILCRPPGEERERELSWLDYSVLAGLSRDGRSILIAEQGQGGGPAYGVFLRKTDGSPAVRLGAGRALSSVSPDGRWAISETLGNDPQLVLLPTGPGEPRPLPRAGLVRFVSAAWFPGSDDLLVAGSEEGHGTRLFVQSLRTGGARPISPEGVGRLSPSPVSPDGRSVASVDGEGRILVFATSEGTPASLAGQLPGDVPIAWATDSTGVFVARYGEPPCPIDRIDLRTGRRTLWRQVTPADLSGVLRVMTFDVSADASAYAYSYQRTLSELFVMEDPG